MTDETEECAVCENPEAAFEKEAQGMEKFGFYCHLVPCDDEQTPTGVNYHTHGVQKSFDHPDFQWVVSVPMNFFGSIIHPIVDKVREGEKFEVNKEYFGFLDSQVDGIEMPIAFAYAEECERPVLRIICPDKKGKVLKDEIDEHFGHQYCGTTLELQ